MSETGWLIDKSALARIPVGGETEWPERIQRGLVWIATVTLLEIGYSARRAADLRAGFAEPPISLMPVAYATPAAEERAVFVLQALAERGHHRAPSVADLMVAALAEVAGLVVLHRDKTFELIAEVTGQPIQGL